jgi:penicillin-binding protein 1A
MSENNSKNSKYLRIFWLLFALPFILVVLIFILISNGAMGFLPTFEDLENPKNNLASEVYSSDSVLLGKLYIENRTFVQFEDLSPNIINSLLATEDIRFRNHSGIDARGLGRVLFRTILSGQNTGGGSTITQQLAKNLFERDVRGKNKIARLYRLFIVKFKEWHTAVRLEKFYTKNEILVMYLNTVTFGSETFGIKSASEVFFNSSPDSLKIEQAATLVGLLKAPTLYSPILNPENSLKRRNTVLSQMRKYDFISKAEYDSISQLPLELNYRVQSHNYGPANHFRTYLQNLLIKRLPVRSNYTNYASFVNDSIQWETNPLYGWTNKNFKADGSNYNIYKDGLKIYTAINSRMQQYAEEALNEHFGEKLQQEFFADKKWRKNPPFSDDLTIEDVNIIMNQAMVRTDHYSTLRASGISRDSIVKIFKKPVKMRVFTWEGEKDTIMSPMDSLRYYKYFLRAGFMAMEPSSGHVKAYVGGHNFKYFKYDHVTQSKRQPGSTIKPFLYTLAMQEGFTPCHEILNVAVSIPDNDTIWTPRNSGRFDMEGKMVTLKWGLANSVNYISAWLVKYFNPQAVVDIIRKMGVKSHIDAVPSVILGTSDLTLEEMVGSYNTFANKGVYIQPVYITEIQDKNGNTISTFVPQQTEAISEKTSYLMVQMLRGVVDRGTAGRLRSYFSFKGEMAGKTGTTQNHSDGWYMGIIPQLTAGVWVGAEDRSVSFRYLGQGSGSYMAMPIYGKFLQKVYADTSLHISPEDIFEAPANFNVNLNCPDPDRNRDSYYEEGSEEIEILF